MHFVIYGIGIISSPMGFRNTDSNLIRGRGKPRYVMEAIWSGWVVTGNLSKSRAPISTGTVSTCSCDTKGFYSIPCTSRAVPALNLTCFGSFRPPIRGDENGFERVCI